MFNKQNRKFPSVTSNSRKQLKKNTTKNKMEKLQDHDLRYQLIHGTIPQNIQLFYNQVMQYIFICITDTLISDE